MEVSPAGLMMRTFLCDLPDGVDPCGENGEFHSFVFDGPLFKHPLRVKRGETVVMENRFCYSDFLPG
jgi:diphthamide synthase (EF-2-diphthine--ammonia ligase)